MITLPDASLPNKDSSNWILFGLIAPIAAAVNNIFVAKHFGDKPVTKEMLQEACDEAEKCLGDKKVKAKIDTGSSTITRLVFVVKAFDFGLKSDGGKQILWEDMEL